MPISLLTEDDSRFPVSIGICIRCLIVYSVTMFFIETDWGGSESSVGGKPFYLWSERVCGMLFTIEYYGRIHNARNQKRYLTSWYGLIDFLSVAPFWLGFYLPANPTIYLRVVRSCRILRLLKFVRYMPMVQLLIRALIGSWRELASVGFLCMVVFLFGSEVVFELERHAQPDKFGSLGNTMWWMICTLTTVGYGDLSPITPAGKVVTMFCMLVGIGLASGYVGIIANTVYHVLNPIREADADIRNIDETVKLYHFDRKIKADKNGVKH